MTQKEYIDRICYLLKEYISNSDSFDRNPQLRINPATLDVTIINGKDMLREIEYSNEAIEAAAGVEGAASEDDTDFQARRNPDFYPVMELLRRIPEQASEPDVTAVEKITAEYFS